MGHCINISIYHMLATYSLLLVLCVVVLHHLKHFVGCCITCLVLGFQQLSTYTFVRPKTHHFSSCCNPSIQPTNQPSNHPSIVIAQSVSLLLNIFCCHFFLFVLYVISFKTFMEATTTTIRPRTITS